MAIILNTPGHVALDRIYVWFQDEALFGQQNTTTRILAKKGTRPRAVKQQLFIWRSASGNRGDTSDYCPASNREYMYEHLKRISAATAFGRHALVIMDDAGLHQQDLTNDFNNLIPFRIKVQSPLPIPESTSLSRVLYN